MIKQNPMVAASLDNIYNEIILLSASVGECRSSIDHNEESLARLHLDLKKELKGISSKLLYLETREHFREHRFNFIWGLLQMSPFNLLRWAAAIVMISVLFTAKMNFDIKHVIEHFYESIIN